MTVPIMLSTLEPTRKDFKFLGWSTDKDAFEPIYSPGALYFADADIKLYAVWQIIPVIKCTVTFFPNAYDDAQTPVQASVPLPRYANVSDFINLPAEKATRVGYYLYDFLGWDTDPGSSTPTYQSGGQILVSGDINLYAIWQLKSVVPYTVTYDAGGGTGAPDPQKQANGYFLLLSSKIPTWEGHIFRWWTFGECFWLPGTLYTEMRDAKMVAAWEPDYRIVSGNGSNWYWGSRQGLPFRCNGPLNIFEKLLIDGAEASSNTDYDLSSGSTIAVLKPDYLKALGRGEHTIRFCYTDGQTDVGRFFIVDIPETGDRAPISLWVVLALVSLLSIAKISIRKKKN